MVVNAAVLHAKDIKACVSIICPTASVALHAMAQACKESPKEVSLRLNRVARRDASVFSAVQESKERTQWLELGPDLQERAAHVGAAVNAGGRQVTFFCGGDGDDGAARVSVLCMI